MPIVRIYGLKREGVNCLNGFSQTFKARMKSFARNQIRNLVSQETKHKTGKHQKKKSVVSSKQSVFYVEPSVFNL